MIEIKNVNKYYNRHKKNEIHVINNTSLSLGDHGLVALLGPSGCGKTTLLNAIGGLDHVQNGSIQINGKKVNSFFSSKTDRIRNLNIGYIFQDYRLLDDRTVYDNIALSLKMCGIKNKEEINKRVSYVLEAVNMYRYRNRLASNLSGGERQRVGIARALVKNPPIIIADEPTGNLDSRNTIEIMNIIKAISQTKLVILVTHEKEIAHFYASRIVELQDGKVLNDYENNHDKELDYRLDNRLYLKDYPHHSVVKDDLIQVAYYKNDENPFDVKLVVQNGNLYIQSDGFKKIEIVNDHSDMEMVDDHYRAITKDDYLQAKFDMEEVSSHKRLRYSSINNVFGCIIDGFKKVSNYSFIRKMLLVGFAFSAMSMMLATSQFLGISNITDDKFVTLDKNYLTVNASNITMDVYNNIVNMKGVEYVIPTNSQITLRVPLNYYYQTVNTTDQLSGSLSDVKKLSENDLVYGRLPENNHEIVVDRLAIQKMFDGNHFAQQVGILNVEDMLGVKADVEDVGELTIVGITDGLAPVIYTEPAMFTNLIIRTAGGSGGGFYYEGSGSEANGYIGVKDYELFKDTNQIKLKKGRYPTKYGEVIVDYSLKDTYKLKKKIPYKVNGKKLVVVGYYTSSYGVSDYLVNNETLTTDMITKYANLSIYTKEKSMVMEQLNMVGINAEDPYQTAYQSYRNTLNESIRSTLIISSIMILISMIEIFLMLRSSFLSRIKEIGTYRAIGVKKWDIYKMFIGEIFAITLQTGFLGFAFMAYVIHVLQDIPYIGTNYLLTPSVYIISISAFVLINVIVGLYPLFLTLRKSPAQILSRNDVD